MLKHHDNSASFFFLLNDSKSCLNFKLHIVSNSKNIKFRIMKNSPIDTGQLNLE